MQRGLDGVTAGVRFLARGTRRLAITLAIGFALLAAALGAAWWMARQQDETLARTARSMVTGNIETFADAARTQALDYSVWDDAYDAMAAGNLDWLIRNVGSSIGLGTYQMAVAVLPSGEKVGFEPETTVPIEQVVDPEAITGISATLDAVPIGIRSAPVAFAVSDGELWLLVASRVVPQNRELPADIRNDAVPRLIFGYRVADTLLSQISRLHMLQDFAVSDAPPAVGQDGAPLLGAGGEPVAWFTWTALAPGHAVLRAFLGPLALLAVAVAVGAVLAFRELLRSARRLEEALARAHAADQTKTEFLSNVSHELRTPLGGIIGLGQLLQMHDLDADAREMVDLLLASAHTQLHMVNSLLDISRIETGSIQLGRAPFDPATVVEETTRLAAPDIVAKGLALSVTIAPDTRRSVLGDAHAFRQIVTNLVGNAAKFTSDGQIGVRLDTAPDALVLAVSDTGIGIAPADHRRIFERFVQLDGSPSRRGGGAGLGLAITGALVELMGGAITVDSEPGAGSTFTVRLPAIPAPASAAEAA